jgi:centrosomal protein CEP164
MALSLCSASGGVDQMPIRTVDVLNDSNNEVTGSIVLEEEIDPDYVPTESQGALRKLCYCDSLSYLHCTFEVLEYAKWLGMDTETDSELLWIAKEGLMAPLPCDWKPCKTTDTGDIYYFNFVTAESIWDQ